MHGQQNIKSPDIYVNTQMVPKHRFKPATSCEINSVPLSTVFEAVDMSAHHLRMMHQVQ